MVLGGFHVYKSVFLGWVVGRFNIAVNGERNCGVLPIVLAGKSGKRMTCLDKGKLAGWSLIDNNAHVW